MSGRRTAAIAALGLLLLAGCGGGDEKQPPSNEDLAKISGAMGEITDYCVSEIQSGTGEELGRVGEAVDTLIDQHHDYPDGTFKLVPNGPDITMTQLLRQQETTL